MNKGILAVTHSLLATLLSFGLLYLDPFPGEASFWLVVILVVSWFLWLPLLLSQKTWLSAAVGMTLIAPAALLACKLLAIAYG